MVLIYKTIAVFYNQLFHDQFATFLCFGTALTHLNISMTNLQCFFSVLLKSIFNIKLGLGRQGSILKSKVFLSLLVS